MANNKEYVSVGKPKKIGGAVFRAPKGTTAPTDATTALATAFKCLGYVSEDGVVNSNTKDISEIKAWGGDVVANAVTGHTDTFALTLIEVMNGDVLKTVHGDGNVSGALNSGLSITVNGEEDEEHVYIIDMVLRGDVKKRIVIPAGVVTAVGDITYKDDTLVGYPVTISATPDASENTHYEYITSATSNNG